MLEFEFKKSGDKDSILAKHGLTALQSFTQRCMYKVPYSKFIKSVGEEYQVVRRGREYHGCEEEYNVAKKGEREGISYSL